MLVEVATSGWNLHISPAAADEPETHSVLRGRVTKIDLTSRRIGVNDDGPVADYIMINSFLLWVQSLMSRQFRRCGKRTRIQTLPMRCISETG